MTKLTSRTVLITAAAMLASACSGSPPPDEAAPTQSADANELPPPGYGTLRQDDFTIPLVAANRLQIKVTPLAEGVIRLAAPDTYNRLHGMVASRSDRIQRMAQTNGIRGEPKVFLVSFFTYDQQVAYDPSAVQILNQGIIYFQRGIIPLTPDWGREQVKQQEVQSALYMFDSAIDLEVLTEVQYNNSRSMAWSRIIRVLQAERGRVISRAKG
jgi:hypothetical protein